MIYLYPLINLYIVKFNDTKNDYIEHPFYFATCIYNSQNSIPNIPINFRKHILSESKLKQQQTK